MERLKLVLGTVATVALVKLAWSGVPGVAAAQAAEVPRVSCEVFFVGLPGGVMGAEKFREKMVETVAPIATWLEAHPGSTSFSDQMFPGYYTICVREQ